MRSGGGRSVWLRGAWPAGDFSESPVCLVLFAQPCGHATFGLLGFICEPSKREGCLRVSASAAVQAT